MDEPETPLSPIRVLALLRLIGDAAREGSQFVIATHSPMLMALPGAALLSFEAGAIRAVAYDDVEHVRVTRDSSPRRNGICDRSSVRPNARSESRGMVPKSIARRTNERMTMQAQTLVSALNAIAGKPQFDASKARAIARKTADVDWPATKRADADFNADVDGCPTFVMLDGSVCVWAPARGRYAARATL